MKIIDLGRIASRVDLYNIVKLIFKKKITNFKIKFSNYSTDFSIEKIWCSFDLGTEELLVNILGLGYVPVEDSPHYTHIRKLIELDQSIDKSYFDYLNTYYPNEDIKKTMLRFEELFEKIKKKEFIKEILVEMPNNSNEKFRVIDGTHRIAILTALGITRISCLGKI